MAQQRGTWIAGYEGHSPRDRWSNVTQVSLGGDFQLRSISGKGKLLSECGVYLGYEQNHAATSNVPGF
jgi:hypothetical protein